MKILYSLPHPSHRLDTPGAGHTVRANALLNALENLSCDVIRDQAAAQQTGKTASGTYRGLVKRVLPRPIALALRDRGRVAFGKQYGHRLAALAQQHRPDVILQTHIAYSLSGKIAAEAAGVPLVLDDVAPSWEEERAYGTGSAKLARETHHAMMTAAGLCVAVCGPMRRALEDDGVPPDKLITVPNGVPDDVLRTTIDADAVRAQYQFGTEAVVIVWVGSFQPYHRVDLLVEAFAHVAAHHPNARLLLVGDGTERPPAEQLVNKLAIAHRVTFTGQVPHDRVPQHIAAGDIAVIPAHATYTNPMKLYEYMALGVASVAPRHATITEIGTPDVDLLTFPPGDANALAATLIRLIQDPTLRNRLGAGARSTIAQGHTWQDRAHTLLHAMERLV